MLENGAPENKADLEQIFPGFYDNEVIQKLGKKPYWTVSTTQQVDPKKSKKMPVDMWALMHKEKIWGCAFDRTDDEGKPYNPLVDLDTLCNFLPTAANHAYYLNARRDGYVVMDIEPSCPDTLKEKLAALPYLYGETSMSGKGLHLIFEKPPILENYPNAMEKAALRDPSGFFEILTNHWVTFTRNVLPEQEHVSSYTDFVNVFERLASIQKESMKVDAIDAFDIDFDTIPYVDELMRALRGQDYKKTPDDFHKKDRHGNILPELDGSGYEFGMIGFFYRQLEKLMPGCKYKDHEYTPEERGMLIYTVVKERVPYREKHDEERGRMPYLLWSVMRAISMNDNKKV